MFGEGNVAKISPKTTCPLAYISRISRICGSHGDEYRNFNFNFVSINALYFYIIFALGNVPNY
jgi:hypothetical protein